MKMKSSRWLTWGLCQQYVSSRLSRNLVPCIGVLQMVAGHSRWRRRILWHGPFERCAWVSAGAAPSKKLRPSSYKIVSANFALTEFSEIRRLENVLQGQERDQHSEHAADQPL